MPKTHILTEFSAFLMCIAYKKYRGDSGTWTHDLLNAIQALSQLSYAPKQYLSYTKTAVISRQKWKIYRAFILKG